MTVNTVTDRITYPANGSTTTFVFDFPAVAPQYLSVFVTDSVGNTIQLPTASYTLVLNPTIDPNPTSWGGTVTFPISGPPLAIGNLLTIIRELDPIQSVSLSNQSIIYPPVIEAEFDYLTLLFQQGSADFSRAFRVGPTDPIPAIVPPVGQRANQGAFFDALGNLVPGLIPGPGVFISAAMQPVVGAGTLPLARELMGISPPPITINTTHVVTDLNDRTVLNLTGGYYSVTIGDHLSYSDPFWVFIYNNSNRGKSISITGGPAQFILWPGQFIWIFNTNTGWATTNPGRWHANAAVNIFVNYAIGSDSSDGLGNGAEAFKTIQHAIDVVERDIDGGITVNLEDGTHQVGAGVICQLPVLGSNGYSIVGNVATPNNVIVNGDNGSKIFYIKDNSVLELTGMRLAINSGSGTCVKAEFGAIVTLRGVNFGHAGPSGNHIYAASNSTIFVLGPYHILAGAIAESHVRAESAATIVYDPGLCTMDGPIAIAFFAVVTFMGTMHSNAHVQNFGGGPNSGQSYLVTYNAVGTIGFASPPGSLGSASAGGIWVS